MVNVKTPTHFFLGLKIVKIAFFFIISKTNKKHENFYIITSSVPIVIRLTLTEIDTLGLLVLQQSIKYCFNFVSLIIGKFIKKS